MDLAVTMLSRLRKLRGKDDYVAPTAEQLEAYGGLVRELCRGQATDLHAEGLQVVVYPELPGFTWLVEAEGLRRGTGILVLARQARRELLIEAPHTFFDEGTLELAVRSFVALGARALLVNSTPRTGGPTQGGSLTKQERAQSVRSGQAPADVAHLEDSCFNRAHLELLGCLPHPLTLQWHGFRDELAPGVQVAISLADTPGELAPLVSQLEALLGEGSVKIASTELKRLGATGNRQGQACRERGVPFVHLELSAQLRKQLAASAELRDRFLASVAEGLPSIHP